MSGRLDVKFTIKTRSLTDVLFFDFKKAFDTVCHSKLLVKLKSYGISENLLSWIEAFLCGRSQSVRIGSCIFSKIPVISGVPQGSVLGPTLFLIYINDVIGMFSDLSVSLSLLADDLKLYTCYKTDILHNDLHTAINRLTEWAKLWQLQVAIPKCSAFRISNPQWHVCESVQQITYRLDGFLKKGLQ